MKTPRFSFKFKAMCTNAAGRTIVKTFRLEYHSDGIAFHEEGTDDAPHQVSYAEFEPLERGGEIRWQGGSLKEAVTLK